MAVQLSETILKAASREQIAVASVSSLPEWGYGLTLQQYRDKFSWIENCARAADGRLRWW